MHKINLKLTKCHHNFCINKKPKTKPRNQAQMKKLLNIIMLI